MTIENEWQRFKKLCLSRYSPKVIEGAHLRDMFFAGATATLWLLIQIGQNRKRTPTDQLAFANMLYAEVLAWKMQLPNQPVTGTPKPRRKVRRKVRRRR